MYFVIVQCNPQVKTETKRGSEAGLAEFQVREEEHSTDNGETTELTLNSMGFSSGVWSPMNFHWLLCIQHQ